MVSQYIDQLIVELGNNSILSLTNCQSDHIVMTVFSSLLLLYFYKFLSNLMIQSKQCFKKLKLLFRFCLRHMKLGGLL